MTNDSGRVAVGEQALAVPVEPASSLAASRFDPSRVGLGLYKVHWLAGGTSLAAVFMNREGTRMIAPTNWSTPGKLETSGWGGVARLDRIDPPAEDCPHCHGEGEVEHPFLEGAYGGSHAINPPDPVMVECEDCGGTGKAPDDE